MTLTLLFELKSTDTDFFLKAMGYLMHKTRARLDLRFLPSLLAPVVVLRFLSFLAFSIASFLAIVIGVEVTKTNTSFLTSISFFKDIC